MKNYEILLVEDEKQMSMVIEMELTHEGYDVDIAYDGREALMKVNDKKYNLIILDIMLPEIDGIEVCKKIRQFSNIPIIMLTAKSSVYDRVLGLDEGADDYLTKPFAIEELLARIRVIERNNNTENENSLFKVRNVILDDNIHKVWRAGKEIKLTKKEYDLLHMLLINKNIVLTRKQLIDEIWGFESGDTNVIDVTIRYLRSKIDDDFEDKIITTIRGIGYVIKEN